ncbi:MAG: beta-galactosidase, partial [Kiritimatiellae bacterium]|nr:beta-galactosidase [Kiritimatiellia bacterium]
AWIERLAVIPRDVETGALDLTVTLGGIWGETSGTLFLNGIPVGKLNIEKGAETASCPVKIPGLTPWTPENPVLHLAELELDGQRIIERFGLRTLSTSGSDILLNGEPLHLRGFCRHEAHPQFGPALPHAQLVQDLQLLKSMGCNFVRGAHYPQDPRFLDLCDETGMLVFEESIGWNQKERHFTSKTYVEACEQQTRLMVRNSINHPSVFLWGFLNEGNSDHPSSDHLYPRLAAAVREEDDSRLVTYATNQPWEDRHFAHADVLAVNLYPGWYAPSDGESRPLEAVRETLEKLEANVDANPDAKGKPLFMSEIGGGAIYGWHDPLRVHWSEEYQSDLLDTILRELDAHPRYCGVALWQFCDGRTYANPRSLSRPRAFNNKGVFDEYRRPKMAVQTVTRHWRT